MPFIVSETKTSWQWNPTSIEPPVRILQAADPVESQYHDLKLNRQKWLFLPDYSDLCLPKLSLKYNTATWGTSHGVAAGVASRGVLCHSFLTNVLFLPGPWPARLAIQIGQGGLADCGQGKAAICFESLAGGFEAIFYSIVSLHCSLVSCHLPGKPHLNLALSKAGLVASLRRLGVYSWIWCGCMLKGVSQSSWKVMMLAFGGQKDLKILIHTALLTGTERPNFFQNCYWHIFWIMFRLLFKIANTISLTLKKQVFLMSRHHHLF